MNTYLMTASEIAEIFGITPRRVTQYRDEKMLPIIERGKFDVAWLLYLRKGQERAAKLSRKPHRDTLVALGWLGDVGDEPSDDDLAAFCKLFERNGVTRDSAMLAVGRGAQLLTQ